MKSFLFAAALAVPHLGAAQTAPVRILFDALHAETAGNADWTIDADVAGRPQRVPTPAQSTITATTPETYWTGGISAWGVALAQRGYQVETLPATGRLTYGTPANAQDLSNYKVFIVDEPNGPFSVAEKAALLAFVRGGGGLLMVSDHNQSDRDGDGWDSPRIWNDFLSTTPGAGGLGLAFDLVNISPATTNVPLAPTDSLLHGPAGNVAQMAYHNGTTLTLDPALNPSVRGVVFNTGAANTGTTGALMAYGRFGAGKFAALGDSSPTDDGTGAPGKALFNGWSAEAGGDHARLLLNATIWLATARRPLSSRAGAALTVPRWYPTPTAGWLALPVAPVGTVQVYDALGRAVAVPPPAAPARLDLSSLPAGGYWLRYGLPDGRTATQRIVRE